MTALIDELCRELGNYFVRDVVDGDFAVDGGVLLPHPDLALLPGQYYCVVGSIFNDGVHRFPDADLADEVFSGEVWAMAVPAGFIRLAELVAQYRRTWDDMAARGTWTGFASESFGGYTYTLPTTAPVELREMAGQIVSGKRVWRRCL